MIEFILARYNYWIAIILMMTGLYIVFSRGNLVKKVIGLNIFQTSVFIFYISIGKVANGTAPIFLGGHGEENHGDDSSHGDGEHIVSDTHSAQTDHAVEVAKSLHDKVSNSHIAEANDLSTIKDAVIAHGGSTDAKSLHAMPDSIANDLADKMTNKIGMLGSETTNVTGAIALDLGDETRNLAEDLVQHAGDTVHGDTVEHGAAAVGDVLYSNPLPHVLILTAIVVGVATTAVGLALAVRIREAYGTIEEDELEVADDIAEFGRDASIAGETAGAELAGQGA